MSYVPFFFLLCALIFARTAKPGEGSFWYWTYTAAAVFSFVFYKLMKE